MQLDVSDVRYAPVDLEHVSGYFVEAGDLLFTRYSGNPDFVAACAVVPSVQPTLHPDKLIRVVLDENKANPSFVSLVINNGSARKQIQGMLKTTAGQVGISGGQLRTVKIGLPPLQVQQEVVRRVSAFLEPCARVETSILQLKARSQMERRRILKAAFEGALSDPWIEPFV